MDIRYFLSHLAAMAVLLGIFLILVTMFKHKKKRPLKTQIICPRSKRVLMDFELLHGHCLSCISMNASYNRELKDAGIKKCEESIKAQLSKAIKDESDGLSV